MEANNKTTLNWYELLKDKDYVYLKEGLLKNLIKQGAEKSGSLSKLCVELNWSWPYTVLRENRNGISVKKLKDLLRYLDTDFDFINDKIYGIKKGAKWSVKSPKFPINLTHQKIGSILGHITSDGCLYYDQCRNNFIRTKYCSNDKQALTMFKKDVDDVFGDVTFNKEFIRNSTVLRIGTGLVGETLRFAGGTVGKKYEIDNPIPWAIREGSKDIQREYLSAIFDDEGSVGEKHFPYVILSRYIHTNFEEEEQEILNKYIVPLMKCHAFPTGHVTKRIAIGLLRSRLKNREDCALLKKVLNCKPKVLIGESDLLRNEFGINNHVYVMSLHLTPNNNYSVQSSLVIRNKEDVVNFYKDVGFNLTRKQDKLKHALVNSRWLNYGA